MDKKSINVRIRPITKNDTPLIVKWRNHPDVRENFLWRETLTEEGHTKWLEEKVFKGSVAQFIIEIEEKTYLPVGSVYIQNIGMPGKLPEFGIFIGEAEARGKGIGLQATVQIIEYGFKELNLDKIILRVLEKNAGAIKSYMRAGFVPAEIPDTEASSINGEKIVFMEINR